MPIPAAALRRAALVCAVLAAGTATVADAEHAPSNTPAAHGRQTPVVVTGAWVREAARDQSATSAYATLDNPSKTPASLVAVDVEGAGLVELHEMKVSGEMMGMARVSAVTVPAGGRVVLAPGGLHVMAFKLTRAFTAGTTAALTFRFADGTAVRTLAVVRRKSE